MADKKTSVLPAAAAAGTSILGGVVSAISQNYQRKRQNQYNEEQRQKQNAWNLQQWQRENEYNNPKNQIERLKSAGLNPALMYANGVGGLTAAHSPQMSSSQDTAQNRTPIGNALGNLNFQDMQLKQAQIENINADTAQKESLTEGQGYRNQILESDASFRDAFNANKLDLQGISIDTGGQRIQMNDEQLTLLRGKVSQINKDTELLNERIKNMQANTALLESKKIEQDIVNSLREPQMRAQIQNIQSITGLNEQKLIESMAMLPKALAEKDMNIFYKSNLGVYLQKQGVHIELKDDKLQWEIKQAKRYDDIKNVTGIVGDVVSMAAKFLP